MKKVTIIFIILALTSSSLYADLGSFGLSSARSTGVGNTGVAMMDRLYSYQMNPASLRNFDDSTFFEFTNIAILPNFHINGSNNILPIEDLNLYFAGVDGEPYYLEDKDKSKLVSNFNGVGKILFNTKINLLAAAIQFNDKIGAFGISIDEHVNARLNLPNDLARLVLYGNPRGEEYEFQDFAYQVSWTRSIGLSWAKNIYSDSTGAIRNLNFGTTIKYYQGLGFADLVTERGRVFTNQDANIEFDFLASGRASSSAILNGFVNDGGNIDGLPESAGSGLGIDLGVLGELDNGIRFGFSITDLGMMNFSEGINVADYKMNETITGQNINDIDSVFENGVEKIIDENTSEFSVTPPTTIRLGFAVPIHKLMAFPGLFNAYFDYTQGINNNFANAMIPRFSLGVDWKPFEYLPTIMTGIGNGITGNVRWSLGLGYEIWKIGFYVSTYDMMSVINTNTNLSASFNFRWRLY